METPPPPGNGSFVLETAFSGNTYTTSGFQDGSSSGTYALVPLNTCVSMIQLNDLNHPATVYAAYASPSNGLFAARQVSSGGWQFSTFATAPVPPFIFETNVVWDEFSWTDVTNITITGYTGSGGNVIIPDTIDGLPVTEIAGEGYNETNNGAFYGCGNVTSVYIPNSVTSIGTNAFSVCWRLTSVTIGSGVTSIGPEHSSPAPA